MTECLVVTQEQMDRLKADPDWVWVPSSKNAPANLPTAAYGVFDGANLFPLPEVSLNRAARRRMR